MQPDTPDQSDVATTYSAAPQVQAGVNATMAIDAAWLRAASWHRELVLQVNEVGACLRSGRWDAAAEDALANAADAIARSAHAFLEGAKDDGEQSGGGLDQEVSASHVAGAERIRSSVAEFRERFRAEHAERARRAADDRQRFMKRLRGEHESSMPASEATAEQDAEAVTAESPVPAASADGQPGIRFRQRRSDDGCAQEPSDPRATTRVTEGESGS
ncbi:MAG: hypothetical protein AAF937_01765 [Planctomycetota bacterium]